MRRSPLKSLDIGRCPYTTKTRSRRTWLSWGIIVTAMKQKYSKDYALSQSGYQLVLPPSLETPTS